MRIFSGVLWKRGVKRQWGNRKRRFSGLSGARFIGNKANIFLKYYLFPCRLSTDPKIHDLEWPFYDKFSLLQTALSEIILHTYRRVYLYHVTSGDVRKWTMIRRIYGILGRTADLL